MLVFTITTIIIGIIIVIIIIGCGGGPSGGPSGSSNGAKLEAAELNEGLFVTKAEVSRQSVARATSR